VLNESTKPYSETHILPVWGIRYIKFVAGNLLVKWNINVIESICLYQQDYRHKLYRVISCC